MLASSVRRTSFRFGGTCHIWSARGFMDFDRLLRFAVEHDASDVHIQAGLPPHLRLGGHLKATDHPAVDDKELRGFIAAIAPPRFRDNLDDRLPGGVDFSYALPGGTRFRCSAYSHMSQAGISMRTIKN